MNIKGNLIVSGEDVGLALHDIRRRMASNPADVLRPGVCTNPHNGSWPVTILPLQQGDAEGIILDELPTAYGLALSSSNESFTT